MGLLRRRIIGAVIFAAIAATACAPSGTDRRAATVDSSTFSTAMAARPASAAALAREVTYYIINFQCDGGVTTGSGFHIGDGLVVTNDHVVSNSRSVEVHSWNGAKHETTQARSSGIVDLAVLRVPSLDGAPAIEESAPTVRNGATVRASGYPGGGAHELTEGTVLGREVTSNGTVIMTTATVIPGNSGGPLLDTEGRLAGVVYALRDELSRIIEVNDIERLRSNERFPRDPGCG